MASITDDFKNTFRDKGKLLQQVIVITVIAYVVQNIFAHVIKVDLTLYLGLPGSFLNSVLQLWSYVSYMFLHGGLRHILFNMLILYWFGRLLQQYLGSQKVGAIYFVGGIAGGLAYVLAYSLFQILGIPMGSVLIGASAGVMAVMVATAVLLPDYVFHLFLIGPVRIKYIALTLFVLTSLLDFSWNTGGKLAHVGGAIYGWLFIAQSRKGKDISFGFYRLSKWFTGLFSGKKTKMRVVKNETRGAKRERTAKGSAHQRQRRVDEILDKISKSGYDSLTKEEKEFLFKMSNDN